jgi:hypothetical protein
MLRCTISSHGVWHPDIRLDRCAVGDKKLLCAALTEEDQDDVAISVFATNIQLVRQAHQIVENAGRPIATPDEAPQILRLKTRT